MCSRLCSHRLHVSYQAWCKLAFQFFNRVGPLEWFGGLVVVGNEVQDGLLKRIKTAEMVGLEEFALQQTEPNFDLIEPRGIGRQPIELHRQFYIQRRRSFLDPARELLGCMSRSIIQDERHGLYPTAWCYYQQDGLYKAAEVDKAFARVALPIDETISDAQRCHQVQCASPDVTRGLIHRMLVDGWTRSLFGLTSLKRGFLIGTDDPDALLKQSSGLFIQLEHRAGALQKDLRILDVLPGMEPEGDGSARR